MAKVCLTAGLGFLLTAALALSAHAADKPKWIKAQSEHFTVYSDTPAKTTTAYLVRLEKYRHILSGFYGMKGQDDAVVPPLNLYFLNSRADMLQMWPGVSPYVMGFYKACTEGQAAIALEQDDRLIETKTVEAQAENTSQTVLFHEYAHNFMYQHSDRRYPAWFVEGFAEFYGPTKLLDDQAIVGMAWSDRVRTLMEPGGLKYEDILRNAPNVRKTSSNTFDFYAQSWLLTHWILSAPDRKEKIWEFFDACDRGDDPVAAFESTFGVKVATLSRTLDKYLMSLTATVYRIHNMPTPQVTVTDMPVAANKLLLWDAAVNICMAGKDPKARVADIRREAANFPGDDFAMLAVARADIIFGDEAQALEPLKAYTAAHPDDSDALFMLGQTWYLMTAHDRLAPGETKASQMQKARAALSEAYGLDPLNAPNLYYFSLAQADRPGHPTENAINAVVEAHYLMPAVDAYAIYAADLLVQRDRMDEAREMLFGLASDPHGGNKADWAYAIIEAIDADQPSEAVLKLLRTPIAPDAKADDKDSKDKRPGAKTKS